MYRTLWVVRDHLPDARLVSVAVSEAGGVAEVEVTLRSGRVSPVLTRAMAAFSGRFAETGLFDIDLAHAARPPDLQVWFESVEDRLLGNLPLNVHYGGVSSRFFTTLVDRDLVDPAFLREMNEEAMPTICGLLVATAGRSAPEG
jgi:hypothetical protein